MANAQESSSIDSLVKVIDGWVSTIGQIVKLSSADNVGSYISVVGIILLIFSIWAAYKLIQTNVAKITPWHKALTFTTLAFSILCVVLGPAISVFYFGSQQQRIAHERGLTLASLVHNNVSQKDILDRAKNNYHVQYLIRLIPYDPTKEKELSLERVSLASIGPPLQRFTFVADYDELKGYTVADAVQRSGLPFREGQQVTAIIFPLLSPRVLIPANARGLLQVLDRTASSSDNFRINTLDKLSSASKRNISQTDSEKSYNFDFYKNRYPEMCAASFEFVCHKDQFSVTSLMGKVTHDWHPLGFARLISLVQDPCEHSEMIQSYCEIKDWPESDNSLVKEVGARIFFTENDLIANIKGRILIDFHDPARQRIPLILSNDKIQVISSDLR